MLPRVLAFLLVAGVAVSAQTSQPPTPGARAAARKQPQPEAARADQQPSSDPRGTRETPLVVQVQPTAKTDKEAANEQAQEHEKASEKWWAFAVGITTGVVALLQIFAVGFQVYIAKRQNAIIEKQSAIMEGQREAAEVQSSHMEKGLSEARLAADAQASHNSAILQRVEVVADSLKVTADAATKALGLAYRPYFDVRDLTVSDNQKHEWPLEDARQPPLRLTVSYLVFNASQTPTNLVSYRRRFVIDADPSEDWDQDSSGTSVIATMIAPGRGYRYPVIEGYELSDAARKAYLDPGGMCIDVIYTLRFTDPFGNEHSQEIRRRVLCNLGVCRSLLADGTPTEEHNT